MAPTKSTIAALGARDVGPDGRQSFSLLLEYSFKQTEAGEVIVKHLKGHEDVHDVEYYSIPDNCCSQSVSPSIDEGTETLFSNTDRMASVTTN